MLEIKSDDFVQCMEDLRDKRALTNISTYLQGC